MTRSKTSRNPEIRPQSKGASQVAGSMMGRLRSWLKHHQRVSGESLGYLFKSGFSSLMTWMVIGIALALPAILLILLTNLSNLSGSWEGSPRINLFLQSKFPETEIQSVIEELKDWPGVRDVVFISSDNALEEFKRLSGFGEVILALDTNPLPAVLLVEPSVHESATISILVKKLQARPEADSVSVDMQWIQRLNALLGLGKRMVTAISAFLALGVVLIIGNTIRLSIEARRTEIEVIKLVGGTDAFVRRPFLYLGFWFGMGGALIAWVLLISSILYIEAPIKKLAGAYGEQFALQGLDIQQTLLLWGLGALLGIAGAWLAVGRHLRSLDPN